VTVAVLIVAGLVFLFFYRRNQEQNTRVYAAIADADDGHADATAVDGKLASSREDVEAVLPAIRKRFNSRRREKN